SRRTGVGVGSVGAWLQNKNSYAVSTESPFDTNGNLYAAVNDTNRLYRLSLPSGTLNRLADRSDGLSYPTQPTFNSTTLYLTDGAFANGVADLEAFDVEPPGAPCRGKHAGTRATQLDRIHADWPRVRGRARLMYTARLGERSHGRRGCCG